MKRLLVGLIFGIVLGIVGCFFYLDLSSNCIDYTKQCSRPEFIYFVSQIFGVLATFMAVFVALFGNEIRSMLFRGKCKLTLVNDGFDEFLGDSANDISPKAHYYDCVLDVKNSGAKEISECELLITGITYKSSQDQKKSKNLLLNGHNILYWTNREVKKVNMISGDSRDICLFRIYPSSAAQTPDGGFESPLHINISGYNMDSRYSAKGIWTVEYKLQTKDHVINQFSVTVEWSGKWFDRYNEMGNEINVNLKHIKK